MLAHASMATTATSVEFLRATPRATPSQVAIEVSARFAPMPYVGCTTLFLARRAMTRRYTKTATTAFFIGTPTGGGGSATAPLSAPAAPRRLMTSGNQTRAACQALLPLDNTGLGRTRLAGQTGTTSRSLPAGLGEGVDKLELRRWLLPYSLGVSLKRDVQQSCHAFAPQTCKPCKKSLPGPI